MSIHKPELVIPRGLPRGAFQFLLLTLAKRADFGFLRLSPQLAAGIGAGRAERIYYNFLSFHPLLKLGHDKRADCTKP